MNHLVLRSACAAAVCGSLCAPASAHASSSQNVGQSQEAKNNDTATAVSAPLPRDYVIGTEDALSIVFWKDPELSAEVVVRPDGKISLPLLKDVQAAGYTPEQLTDHLVQAAARYIARPTATVIVKAINSRKVYIIGQVTKPGAFPLAGEMTVLQLIALAGDVLEYAHSKDIVVMRKEDKREVRFKFNYKNVVKGKETEQNILLKPGDTVIVP